MAARGSRGVQRSRTDSERARLYAARTAWHTGLSARRRRDTITASIVGGLIVLAAVVSQTVLAQVTAAEPGPSQPVQTPTTPAPTPLSSLPASPTPAQTPGE